MLRRAYVRLLPGQKVMFSQIERRMVTYSKCQAIQACDFFTYDLELLKSAYNEELVYQGIDAQVEQVKELRGTFQSNLITDLWVSTTSPLPPAVVALIIFILSVTAVTVGSILILSAASAFIERIAPRSKFYAPEGKVFESLTEYITYMQNVWNPSQGMPYTCIYCGQGFTTAEERDTHQTNCPWKGGPPVTPTPIENILLLVGIIVVAVVIVPPVIGLIRGKE